MAQPIGAATALPRPLAVLGDALQSLVAPDGPFDPHGSWDHAYQLLTLVPQPNFQPIVANRTGWLRLSRHPGDLAVTFSAGQGPQSQVYLLEARIRCADDRLGTPQSWQMSYRSQAGAGPANAVEPQTITGTVGNGRITWSGATTRSMPAPPAWTSSWSLFDALQRLPGNAGAPPEFDLLEELDLLKPSQRVVFRETVTLGLKGHPVRLHGFDQFGRGLLPYSWWLDDQRRVLVAVGSQRAYLFDPAAGQGGAPR